MRKHLHHKIIGYTTLLLLGIGMFFLKQHLPSAQASMRTLSGGSVTWDNTNFLDETFWSDDPSDDDIIKALYGSGDEGSAYTQHRTGYNSGSCLSRPMTVIHTSTLPAVVSEFTIYVLDSGNYNISSPKSMTRCSAFVTSGTVTFTKTAGVHALNFTDKTQYAIVDNLIINGNNNINHGVYFDSTQSNTIHDIFVEKHTIGIRLSYSSYNAIYSTIVEDSAQQGIYLTNSPYNLFETITSYNNRVGIDISTLSHYNQLSGIVVNKSTLQGFYIRGNSSSTDASYLEVYQNDGDGVYITASSGSILKHFSTYDNGGDGVFLDLTTGTYLYDFDSYRNTVGVRNNDTYGTIATGFSIYSNTRGMDFDTAANSVFSDFESYNNQNGIQIKNSSHHNQLSNFHVYNNLYYGISLDNTSYTTFNNFQSYNNRSNGIEARNSSNHLVIHNAHFFDNDIGIFISSANDVILNAIASYNNTYGLVNNIVSTVYYGTNKIFSNFSSNIGGSQSLIGGTGSYTTTLGRDIGKIVDKENLTRDWITNPINTSGSYLLSRSGGGFNELHGMMTAYENTVTQAYSYGSGISLQQQPVIYIGEDLLTGGTFAPDSYIGGTTIFVTGDTQSIPQYTRYTGLTLTGISEDPLIAKYSFFGHLNFFPLGTNINTFTGITLTNGDGNKLIITQLRADDYFATHFQRNTFLDQTPPSQVVLISPSISSVFDTGNVSLERDESIDTGVGFSGYIFEISMVADFSEILLSGITEDMYVDLTDLEQGQYYRRVFADDILGNTTPIATVRYFFVDLCGNNVVDDEEACDQGPLNDDEGACSTSCMRTIPSCSLSVSPLTGYAPSNHNFTISDIDTGRMNFDWIDFGDGSTGVVDTGTLTYNNIYTNTGIFTGIFQVSNSFAPEISGQCEASVEIFTYEYCGDGVTQSPNSNGFAEACDLGINNSSSSACSTSCTRNTPTCNLSASPLTGYAPLTGAFSVSNIDTGWMQFDQIDFGDGSTGGVETGTLTYTHHYTLAGIFTGTLYISNRYDSSSTGQCSALFTALCEDIAWTPDPSTICSSTSFTQTSNCGTTRQIIGTRNCGGGGGGGNIHQDVCCSISTLPGSNDACVDYSPSYYDNTCLAIDNHEAAGLLCDYDDENYFGNGSFTDTTNHRGFPYIEIMRLSCLHRGVGTSKDKWIYSPNTYIKKSEILKTLVKIMGIAFEDFDITTEDKTYPHTLIFKDLTTTHRFSRYSDYAYTRGLTEGLYQSNTTNLYLSPDLYVSRNDIVKKIIEVYTTIHNGQIPLNSGTNLSDIAPSDPYYPYIRQAESLGFIEGIRQKDGSYIFAGNKYVTRAEFAKMIAIPFSALIMGDEE